MDSTLVRAKEQLQAFLEENRQQTWVGIDRSPVAVAERLRITGWIQGNNALEGHGRPERGSFLDSLHHHYVLGDISSEQAEKVVEIFIGLPT